MTGASQKASGSGSKYTTSIGLASNLLNIVSFIIEKGPSVIAIALAALVFLGIHVQKADDKTPVAPIQKAELAVSKPVAKSDPEKICSDLLPFAVIPSFDEQMKFIDRCVRSRS